MNAGPTSGVLWLPPQSYDEALSRFSREQLNEIDAEQHRHFPPPNGKATLWRYLETYKFDDLLKTETLFLSQVAKLAKDEPNEGRMNQFQKDELAKQFGHDKNQLENFRAFHERIRQRSWVTCFSLADFDEVHMWDRFCRGTPNEGVAIKTNYSKLRLSMDERSISPELCPSCAMVRYKTSAYMPWKLCYLLFQKIPMFSDEREVRVCTLCLEEENPAEFLRVPVNLSRLIHQIYVHPRASGSYMRHVCGLAARHLPKNAWRVRWSRFR